MELFDLMNIDKEKIIKKINFKGIEIGVAKFILANIVIGGRIAPERWIVKKIYPVKDGKGIGVEVDVKNTINKCFGYVDTDD